MAESFPTRENHNNRVGVESYDKRTYLDRYLYFRDPKFDFLDPEDNFYRSRRNNNYYKTAEFALRLVDTRFRFSDISQSIRDDNEQRILAQKLEISVWEERIEKYLRTVPHLRPFFDSCVDDFTLMEMASRIPDTEEYAFIQEGLAGRIGLVVVEASAEEPYSWQDITTHSEPHFIQ